MGDALSFMRDNIAYLLHNLPPLQEEITLKLMQVVYGKQFKPV
jgi:hypothetical protein